MRKSNSVKNASIAIIMNLITILVGFVSQKIFVINLGKEYLGLNGLFNNILSVLSVVELGFGNAIIYHLYKPVAENDNIKIASLLNFYKKAYRIISFAILFLGLLIMPFLGYIVGNINIDNNLYLLFFLALFDIVASYLLTYKRSILYADQKTYITNIVHIGYIIIMNLTEIFILYISKSYLLYLIIKIIFRILENIVITFIANRKYPFIITKKYDYIDSNTKTDIFNKVKGLLFHRIGSALVLGTDNIIISKFLGVVVVGFYSNYNMIITAATNLLSQMFNSLTPTIGNLLLDKDMDKSLNIYHKMLFLNSWLYCFCSCLLICLMQPFITLWMGKSYLLSFDVLTILVINFYVQGMRKTSNVFKEAAGIFYEDRFVPFIESLVNIISSIIFVKLFGLIGVFIGTFLSSLTLFLYSYPVFVYKKLFKKSYSEFIFLHLKYLLATFIIVVVTLLIVNFLRYSSIFVQLISNTIICLIIPNILMLLLFYKNDNFKYFLEFFSNYLKKIIF